MLTIALSPDGSTIAFAGEGPLVLADAVHGRNLLQTELKASALKVAFSPRGRLLAVSMRGGLIEVLDPKTLTVSQSLFCKSDVTALDFDPAEARLATGHGDSSIRIWTLDRQLPPIELFGHSRHVTSVKFSADGRTLVSASEDGTVRIWSAAHPRPLGIVSRQTNLWHEGNKCNVRLSRDNHVMLIAPFSDYRLRQPHLAVWSLGSPD